MKNRSGEKIKLASIDELLGVVNEESAMEIEISKIHPFKNHPFKVLDDEKMQDLVESVKINGILTPVLLRMDENEEYEMAVSYTHLRAHETDSYLVCRLLLEKKKKRNKQKIATKKKHNTSQDNQIHLCNMKSCTS